MVEDTANVRLLAVDDDGDSAELISRIATKCGYHAQAITDSRTIGKILNDWNPQVIMLDLCMPDLDGMQIISLLQNRGFKGHLVVVSGQTSQMRGAAQRLAEAHGLRVADNFAKPIDVKRLSDTLTKLHRTNQTKTFIRNSA